MAMILPKGIIVNSPQIEGQFEQLDAQPVGDADLARLWRGNVANIETKQR